MIITLKDGSKKEYAEAKSVIDIASDISEGLARVACAGEVDGEVVDLRHVVDKDCELSILTFEDEGGKGAFRHTTSHIMAQAIKRLYPDVKLAIGPSIADGFYYDIDSENPITTEDLAKIEAEMKKVVKEALPITRFTKSREEAIAFFKEKNEPYKVELIEDLPEDAEISFYQQGEFVDLCAGPHLMTTKPVKAFKLTSIAGAYWRGSEKNKMLTRIYGTSFTKKADLEEYITRMEEAKKRDHRKLGKELGLFMMSDEVLDSRSSFQREWFLRTHFLTTGERFTRKQDMLRFPHQSFWLVIFGRLPDIGITIKKICTQLLLMSRILQLSQ